MNILEEKIKKIFPFDDIFLLKFELLPLKKIILTIGKKNGITINDCEKISKIVHSIIGNEYYLQVQSSGIGWNIDINSDTAIIFLNEKVKLSYLDNSINKIKNIKGKLVSIQNQNIEIEKNGNKLYIPKKNIKKIKTTL